MRCRRGFKQRVLAYCVEQHALRLEASGTDFAVLADAAPRGAAGVERSESTARLWRARAGLRADVNLRRALDDAYPVTRAAGSLEEVVERTAAAAARLARDGAAPTLRLVVYPRALFGSVEAALPATVALHPKLHTHTCFVVCVQGAGGPAYLHSLLPSAVLEPLPPPPVAGDAWTRAAVAEGEHSAAAEAIRRARLPLQPGVLLVQEGWKAALPNAMYLARALPGGVERVEPQGRSMHMGDDAAAVRTAGVASSGLAAGGHNAGACIDLNVDAERLVSILVEWLPRWLRAGGWVVAVLELGSSAAAREQKLSRARRAAVGGLCGHPRAVALRQRAVRAHDHLPEERVKVTVGVGCVMCTWSGVLSRKRRK